MLPGLGVLLYPRTYSNPSDHNVVSIFVLSPARLSKSSDVVQSVTDCKAPEPTSVKRIRTLCLLIKWSTLIFTFSFGDPLR